MFDVKDPDFRGRVRSSFEFQAVMSTIGASLSKIEPGRRKSVVGG